MADAREIALLAESMSSAVASGQVRRRGMVYPLLPHSGVCLTPGCWWDFYGDGWAEATREHIRVHHHTAIWRAQPAPKSDEVADANASEATE